MQRRTLTDGLAGMRRTVLLKRADSAGGRCTQNTCGRCCLNAPDSVVRLRGKCLRKVTESSWKVPAESAHGAIYFKYASNSLLTHGLHFPGASRKVKLIRKVDGATRNVRGSTYYR